MTCISRYHDVKIITTVFYTVFKSYQQALVGIGIE